MKKICLAATLIAFPLSIMADEVRQHGAHVHGAANLMVSTEGHDLLVALDSPAYNLFGFEHAPSTDAQRRIVSQGLATLRNGERVLMPTAAAACVLESVHIESDTFDTDDHGHGHDDHGHDHDDHGHNHDDHGHGHDDHGHGHDDHGHDHDDHGHGHDDHGHDDHGHNHDDHGHGHDDHGHDHDDHGHGHDDHGHDHDDHGHGHDDHGHGHDDHGHSHDHGHSDVYTEWTFHCDNIDALTDIQVGLFEAFPNLTELDVQYLTEDKQGATELTPRSSRLRF